MALPQKHGPEILDTRSGTGDEYLRTINRIVKGPLRCERTPSLAGGHVDRPTDIVVSCHRWKRCALAAP